VTLAVDIIGWIGATLLLTAYGAVSMGRWQGRSVLFQLFNAFGSAGLIVNSMYYGAYPSVALNIVWILIALWALFGAPRRPQQRFLEPE